jgi:hypothetical protein
VDALLQRVERERAGERDDQFTVERKAVGADAFEGADNLGEIPRERLTILRADFDALIVAMNQRAKTAFTSNWEIDDAPAVVADDSSGRQVQASEPTSAGLQ